MWEKYLKVSENIGNKLPKDSKFGIPIVMIIMASCFAPAFIFQNLLTAILGLLLLVSIIPLCATVIINSRNLKYQSYDYRRSCPKTMLFYAWKNPSTNEIVTEWSMLDMNDEFDRDWYNKYLKPKFIDQGWCVEERGGMTEEQKKAKNRVDKIEKII